MKPSLAYAERIAYNVLDLITRAALPLTTYCHICKFEFRAQIGLSTSHPTNDEE